ncbi:hypothetical protein L596_018088 [Steinernema carpocapsae]|uniref:Uncharacterized protein n=1 Tax=Steinernema carpocapsae TaxID=34508 RepID=A0A4U5N3L6_STECR|nr:hypothetical protein L596_018088 [Steinernema carpocapsae]
MHKLKIGGFKYYPPQSMLANCSVWSLKDCPKPGSDAELLRLALTIADIEYETVQQDLNTTDLIVDCIENGTIDMSILAIRITEDRFDRISYTTPINFLKFGYLIRDTEKLESDDFLLHTFRPEIYPLLLAGLLVTALAVRFLCHFDSGFFTWIWRLFILFFNQDHFFFNPKLKTMFVGGSWIIFAFLVVSYYQGKMKSFLTVPLREGVPFNSLQRVLDKIDSGEWVGIIYRDGYEPSNYCLNEQQCAQVKRLFEEKKILHVTFSEYDKLQNKKGYVSFLGVNTDLLKDDVSIYNNENKILFIQDNVLALEFLSFGINKKYRRELERINSALDMLVSNFGLIVTRYQPAFTPLRSARQPSDDSRITISMIHLTTFFILFVTLIAASVGLFFFEHVLYRLSWKDYSLLRGVLRFHRRRSTSIGVFRRPGTVVLSAQSTYRRRQFYGEYLTY